MGVLDFLFGGSKSTKKPVDVTPPEIAGLRSPFADAMKTLLGGSGAPASMAGIPEFEGPLAAPMAPGEEAALSTLSADDPLQAARRSTLEATLRGDYLPGGPGSNPFLDAAIRAAQRPTLEGLTEALDRSLPGRFTQAGQFVDPRGSSAFDRAAAIATRGATQEMGDIATRMSSGNFEAERGRQMQAVQLGQEEVNTMVTNLQAQALPRLIQDMGLERGREEFQKRLNALLQSLSIITQTPLQTVASKEKSTVGANAVGTLGNIYGSYKGA